MSQALPPGYQPLLSGEVPIPSWLTALLPVAEPPAVASVLERFAAGRFGVTLVDHRVPARRDLPAAEWELEVDLAVAGATPASYRVWLEQAAPLESIHLEWRAMTAQDLEAARACRWALTVSRHLGRQPLDAFHRQLKVLAALAPEAPVFLDVAACTPRPAAWLRDAAAQEVPPPPSNLYCIHAVYDEAGAAGSWLHTHGLLRCGSVELEMLDVPRDHVGAMGGLINAVAAAFLDSGAPPPDERFEAGQGIALEWRPWQRALAGARGLGGAADRDDAHSHPSAVLFAPAGIVKRLFGGAPRSPAIYAEALGENPVLYVSAMETERMSQLARVRLPHFRELFARHGADEETFKFLVKIGYRMDIAGDDESAREHLWFVVHGFAGDRVDATLVNAPYHVAALREGQRGHHDLAAMSDWTILHRELGQFGPDTAVYLERDLARPPQAAV